MEHECSACCCHVTCVPCALRAQQPPRLWNSTHFKTWQHSRYVLVWEEYSRTLITTKHWFANDVSVCQVFSGTHNFQACNLAFLKHFSISSPPPQKTLPNGRLTVLYMCVREKGRLCDPWHTHTHTWTNGRFEIEDNRARERAMTLGKHAVWCVQLRRTKKRDRDCLATLCAFPCGRFHWYMGKQDECVRNSFFFFFAERAMSLLNHCYSLN